MTPVRHLRISEEGLRLLVDLIDGFGAATTTPMISSCDSRVGSTEVGSHVAVA